MVKSGDFVTVKKRGDSFYNHIGVVTGINGLAASVRVKYIEREYLIKDLRIIYEGSEVME